MTKKTKTSVDAFAKVRMPKAEKKLDAFDILDGTAATGAAVVLSNENCRVVSIGDDLFLIVALQVFRDADWKMLIDDLRKLASLAESCKYSILKQFVKTEYAREWDGSFFLPAGIYTELGIQVIGPLDEEEL